MTTFSVTPGTLQAVAGGLSSVGGELTALSKAPSTDPGDLGGGDVESALNYFYHRYGYSVSKLDSHLQSVISNLQQAALNYNTNEACIASGAQFTTGGSGS